MAKKQTDESLSTDNVVEITQRATEKFIEFQDALILLSQFEKRVRSASNAFKCNSNKSFFKLFRWRCLKIFLLPN